MCEPEDTLRVTDSWQLLIKALENCGRQSHAGQRGRIYESLRLVYHEVAAALMPKEADCSEAIVAIVLEQAVRIEQATIGDHRRLVLVRTNRSSDGITRRLGRSVANFG
jgi:hypothetical protein